MKFKRVVKGVIKVTQAVIKSVRCRGYEADYQMEINFRDTRNDLTGWLPFQLKFDEL